MHARVRAYAEALQRADVDLRCSATARAARPICHPTAARPRAASAATGTSARLQNCRNSRVPFA